MAMKKIKELRKDAEEALAAGVANREQLRAAVPALVALQDAERSLQLRLKETAAVIDALSPELENTLIGDCRSMNVMKQIGVPDYDFVVVAVGGNFQASLEITSNLKECGARFIVSQCQSDIQAKFLQMAGADKTVYSEKEAAENTGADIEQLTEEDSV